MIKKVSETTPIQASVVNNTNSSTVDTYSCNYINKLVDYSTNEIKTGAKWVDGKPIYRKTIRLTTTGVFDTGITNVSEIINVSGMFYITGINGWGWQPIPRTTANTGTYGAGVGNIRIQNDTLVSTFYLGTDYDTLDYAYVTYEYTKSTD